LLLNFLDYFPWSTCKSCKEDQYRVHLLHIIIQIIFLRLIEELKTAFSWRYMHACRSDVSSESILSFFELEYYYNFRFSVFFHFLKENSAVWYIRTWCGTHLGNIRSLCSYSYLFPSHACRGRSCNSSSLDCFPWGFWWIFRGSITCRKNMEEQRYHSSVSYILRGYY
jgi:hypothetical protein